jgi:hypothetical protein
MIPSLMPLPPGTKLGPYEITSALGAGEWKKSIEQGIPG